MSATALMTRCLVHAQTGTLVADEPLADARPHQMLVRTTRSLISVGTEMAYRVGGPNLKRTEGRSGYSAVGRIVEPAQQPCVSDVTGAGPGATPFRAGDRIFCHMNHAAQFLWDTECPCYRVPDNITDLQATFGAMGQIAMHMIERAQISIGRTVVVIGQGTVGQLVNQLARRAGAGRVIGVDLSAPARALALQLGADAAIAPDAEAIAVELAKRLPGSASPVFIEVTASSKALEWAIENAPLHARVVVTGTYAHNVTFDPFKAWILKELDIVGAHQPKCPQRQQTYTPHTQGNNLLQVYDMIAKKQLNVDALVDAILTPAQAADFFNTAAAGQRSCRQPVINWETL
ncbi:MAG TPA: zinc-binding alcohol dehydrogenase [Planctomycetota bacterium]|nr:zinc-binding alcohol dehydrogenase [Planctomycetota bacterium]